MTAPVPRASARGTLRPGSRISSATYAAAFHPEYVNITGTSASSQLLAGTASCGAKWAVDPTPSDTPSTTNSTSADTFRLASTLLTIRPGPTPRICTQDIAAITRMAVNACGEIVNGTTGRRRVRNGVRSAAKGAKRPT